MTDSKIRLGTFRIPENTWKDFVAKARSSGDNASSILLNTVHAYLNSEVNSHSPMTPIAISTIPTPTSNPAPAIAAEALATTSSSTLSTNSNSPISILLAIAPDNQILYIDRGIPQHWSPPYQLRNTNANASTHPHPDYRLEFLTPSDSSILPPIEDALVKTFKPTFNFNFKTNLDSHIDNINDIDKQLQPTTAAASIPLHISDRIHSLLTNGLSPEDIHHALNTLHFHSQKSETNPDQNPNLHSHSKQINSAIATLANISNRISALEENLMLLQPTISTNSTISLEPNLEAKPTTTRANTDTTVPDQNQTKPKSLTLPTDQHTQSPSTTNPKRLSLPLLPLKGSASVKQLPSPLGTTDLAQRLKITVKRLEKVRSQYKNSTEGFFKYTLNKENGKFGWIYDPTKRLHTPYLEVPTTVTTASKEIQTSPNPSDVDKKSHSTATKLQTEKLDTKSKSTQKLKPKPQPLPLLLPLPLPALNQSQLAKRFGLNSSSLSRKRSSFSNGYISAEDFDSWCRSKDPDNFTWAYSEDSQDYTCKL